MPQRNVSVHARCTILCQTLPATLSVQADDVATPWEQPYGGNDATGSHVLGLWKFDSDDGVDSSGKNPPATIRNGKLSSAGKFCGAFESFAGYRL